ncbi:MAG: hypothetical protein AB8G11_04555 [Saprospiraceae bacterium]
MDNLNYLLIVLNFLVLVYSAKKNVNDKVNNSISNGIILFGLIAMCVSFFLVYEDEVKLLQKQSDNEKLSIKLSKLDSKSQNQLYIIDSLSKMTEAIKRSSTAICSEFLSFTTDDEIYPIQGVLEKGMTLKISTSNCENNVVLMHNEKRIPIKDNNKVIVEATGEINKSYLINTGRSPCGMSIEIFHSPNPTLTNNNVNIILEIEDKSKYTHLSVCSINEVNLSGTWELIEKYTHCNDILYEDYLNVHFRINEFILNNDNRYELTGYKYAEDSETNGLRYYELNESPVHLKNGRLLNELSNQDIPNNVKKCSIEIPIGDGNGQITLNEVEHRDNTVILKGIFTNANFTCKGTVTMIKVEEDNENVNSF